MQGSVLVRILELRVLIVIDCSKITFATILYTLLKKISMFIGMTSEGGGAVAFLLSSNDFGFEYYTRSR